MKNNPTPTGAEMADRQKKVISNLDEMLRKGSPTRFPPATGWYFIEELEYYVRYQPHIAKAMSAYVNHRLYKGGPMPGWIFKVLLSGVETETIRRRSQELQKPERDAVEKGIIELNEALYLPSERTLTKRKKLEIALKHEYGNGFRTLEDYL